MLRMFDGRKSASGHAKRMGQPSPLIPLLMGRVQDLEEVGIRHVQLKRVDPDNGAVDLVQLPNVICVLAIVRVDVIVELIPPGERGETGTGKGGDGGEVETPDGAVEGVEDGGEEEHGDDIVIERG